MTLPHLFEE